MKLLIVLSLIACSYAAKLDRTYLPPASASSAGGGPDTLSTPLGSAGQTVQSSKPSGFGQPTGSSNFGQSTGPALGKTSGQEEAFGRGQQPGATNLGLSSGAPQYSQTSKSAPYATGTNSYGQSGSGFGQPAQSFSSPNFGQGSQEIQGSNAYTAQRYQPERARASLDRNAEILRYDNQNDGDTFAYSFETSNGISAEESGVATNGVQAQGGYSYTGDDGQVISVVYTADENGYQPRGDHLPTPPPIPDEILKSIEDNARAAAAGTQEGAYRADENDSEYATQQYSKRPASAYDQDQGYTGQIGISAYNRPQGKNPGSQQYGLPNAGAAPSASRPLTGLQGYNQQQNQYQSQRQSQGPSQQYGAPTAGAIPSAGRPSTSPQDYNRQQTQYKSQIRTQAPAQQYNADVSSTASRPLAGVQGFNQPQNQYQPLTPGPVQQYGTPTGSAPRIPASSGSQGVNQLKSSQYNPGFSQSGQFTPVGSAQGFLVQNGNARSQNQDRSGYQYNNPQGSSQLGRESTQYRPNQAPSQFRPETRPNQESGQLNSGASTHESFPRPNGVFGQGLSPASGPSGQGTFEKTGSFGQFQLTQPSGPKSSMPEQSGYDYNRPESGSGPGSQTSTGSRAQQPGSQQNDFGPNILNQGKPGQTFGGPRQPPSFSSEEGYKY